MIVDLFCRCKCGRKTATRNLPPGYKLKHKYYGVVQGHTPIVQDPVTKEDLIRARDCMMRFNIASEIAKDLLR